MLTCFVDESGCPGKLTSIASAIQPLLVIAGMALDTGAIVRATRDFARISQRYHHGQSRPDQICADLTSELIKGVDVRRAFRADPAAAQLKEAPLLDSVLSLLKTHRARLFGVVIVKVPGEEFDGRAVYGRALCDVAQAFHRTLEREQTHGTVIADFREVTLNGRVGAELLEAKLGVAGDQLPWLLHVPTFGNSEMHAPLQMADLLCSALLWPMAAWRFRTELSGSPALHPTSDEATRRAFRRRLLDLLPQDERPCSAASEEYRVGEGHIAVPLHEVLR
jgi:hypothetical protein